MNYSIISTNVRDENDYLDEWITYHLAIGFEKIIIYDHRSKIPVLPVWGDKVIVYSLDRESFMLPDYIHNYTLKNHKSTWMIVLDADEFIVLFEEKNINTFLEKYEDHGALGLPWSVYGGSGHETKPEGLVKDNYLWRKPDEKTWVKSLINTQYCLRTDDPHRGVYTRPSVNECFEPFEGPITDSPRALAKINHYFTKSRTEYMAKIERGSSNTVPPRPVAWYDDLETSSTVYDDVLRDFGKPKLWDNINGWFNYHNLYTDMVGKFDNAVFVEIGCWEGKSTVFMADKIKRSGRNIKFYAIDVWEDYTQYDVIWKANYEQYLKNIEPIKDYITTIKADSCEVSNQFKDQSVDFVFVDGNHQYDYVKKDIEAWYPKVKSGGIIAGHDYGNFEGVNKAVNEKFNAKIINNCWIHVKS